MRMHTHRVLQDASMLGLSLLLLVESIRGGRECAGQKVLTHGTMPGRKANYSKLAVLTLKKVGEKKLGMISCPHFNASRMNQL